MATKTDMLDAAIDVIGAGGWAKATPTRIATRAGVSLEEFKAEFPTRSDWVKSAYNRALERRVKQYERAARLIPAGNTNPEINVKAAIETVVDGNQVDPLFAATLDLFFVARNNGRLLRDLRRIKKRWDKKLKPARAKLFPPGTPQAVQEVIMTHVQFIGTTAVSNGLDNFDPRPIDVPILGKVLAG